MASEQSGSNARLATVKDIGRKLGLSAMTVSRALNGHPNVKDETRRRVLLEAAKVRYRPNRWARTLVTRRTNIIGMVIPDISHAFFSEITCGVQDSIEKLGYHVMLCNSHQSCEREAKDIEMLLGSRVDGLIVASHYPEDAPERLAELMMEGTPLVLLDRFFPDIDCPCVRADDSAVGRIATEHLIGLGHTAIAHIAGPKISPARLRREGFFAAMRAHGLSVPAGWDLQGAFSREGGYAAMLKMLDGPGRPTAVFAGNDPSAIGAIAAARERGLRIPEDVSIVGAGCIEGSSHPDPYLTTIDWERRAMGEKAAGLLVELMSGATPAGQSDWVFTPSLVVRKSTAAPRRA